MKRSIIYLIIIAVMSLTVACGGGNSGDSDSPTRITKGDAPQLTTPESHGGGYGWENDKCYLCHPIVELEDIHDYNSNLADSFSKVSEEDVGACLYCHGTNGLEGLTADSYQCMLCHTDSSIVSSSRMFAGTHMHDLDQDGEIGNSDCIVCHEFSDMDGVIEITLDFRQSGSGYGDTTDFCLNCHDGNGAFGVTPPALTFEDVATNIYTTYMGTGTTSAEQQTTADIHGVQNGNGQSFADFRGAYSENTEVSCLSCHQVHSSENPYLITELGESADMADEDALNAEVSVTETNFTELCALCHVSPSGAVTSNGLQEVVHDSTYSSNCTDCHYHGAGHGETNSGLF